MKFFFLRLATPPLPPTTSVAVCISLQQQKQSNTAETQAPTAAKLLKRATNKNNNKEGRNSIRSSSDSEKLIPRDSRRRRILKIPPDFLAPSSWEGDKPRFRAKNEGIILMSRIGRGDRPF
jgi:hypothetical protein